MADGALPGGDPSSCSTARLHVGSFARRQELRGDLSVNNSCERAIAVLTAPAETRLRLSADDRFLVEAGVSQVYAVAYIFRKEVGLEKSAFRGDGGRQIFDFPDYVVVPPKSTVAIPVTSGAPLDLEPGHYGLALFTIAVWATDSAPEQGRINLLRDVDRFAQERGKRTTVRLPLAATRFSPIAFFEVLPP